MPANRLHESLRRITETKDSFLSPKKGVIVRVVKGFHGKKHKPLSILRLSMNIRHET